MDIMNNRIKNTLFPVLVIICILLAVRLYFYSMRDKANQEKVNSTLVVERIQKVMKLVAVESNFSELMNYNDFQYVDFPGFRKDALVKVNAKVSIGYNLDSLKIKTNEKDKTIIIEHMPKPEVLSIDTDISFENLSEGWFNHFSKEELTKLNKLAKDKIKQHALAPELVKQAEEQKRELFDLLFYMAKENGYKIISEGKALTPIQNLNQ